MKSFKHAFNEKDEYKTPKVLVDIIKPYIKPQWVVWCPCDKEDSEFVKEISKTNKVIYSHIDNGEDFLLYTPDEHFDCIITNIPFSLKLKFFEKAYQLGKPFAFLCNLMCINYNVITEFFLTHELQLLIPNKKVSFDGNTSSFNSSFFCSKMLDKQLKFVRVANNNVKRKGDEQNG